jgi:hypothetical protein
MFRAVSKLAGMLVLIVVGAGGLYWYSAHDTTERRLREVEAKNAQLQQIVTRLTDEKRVAEVLVTEQKTVNGVPQTTILFVETARDGSPLPPKSFTLCGRYVHVSAQVIRFEPELVKAGDPLRGHSIALFTGIYGDQQRPADAQAIDEPGTIPAVYRGADPRISDFEQDLWKDFWRLFNDESFRKEKGVRAAYGQDVYGPFEPDKLYTITIQPNAGLTMTSEPLKPIYRELMKQRVSSAQ